MMAGEKRPAMNSQTSNESLKEKISRAYRTMSPFEDTPREDYTWDQLQNIEKHRRKILTRVEQPFWRVLSHWDGTCLQILVTDTLLYITLGIYAGIRVQARLSLPAGIEQLATGDIGVIGGFLSFFLIFFVNQNYKRYLSNYDKAMTCKGRIFDLAELAKIYFPKENAMRLVRYANAAHVAGYVGLSVTYPSHTFFKEINDELHLLTPSEYARLEAIDLDKGGSCNRELIAWCLAEVAKVHRMGALDHELANQVRSHVLGLRAGTGGMYSAADLPTPFFYVHFICLLTFMYLPLFALSQGYKAGTGADAYWTADIVGGLVVLAQTIFVQGLRILAQKMSDPWGDDLIDLSVIHFCIFNWRMSNRVLRAKIPLNDTTLEEEEALFDKVIDIGAAFLEPDAETGRTSYGRQPSTLKITGEADNFYREKHD